MNVRSRVAAVILGAAAIGITAPVAATVATSYFSQVRTVTAVLSIYSETGVVTAWCPTGWKVTGGGYSGQVPDQMMPTTNKAGRQGWYSKWSGFGTATIKAYAQCIR